MSKQHAVPSRTRRWLLASTLAMGVAASMPLAASAAEPVVLLNVSYDVMRELFKDVNPAFIADWQKKPVKPLPSSNRMAARANRRARWPTAWKRRS